MEKEVSGKFSPREPITSPREVLLPIDKEFRDLCLLNGISEKQVKKHGTDDVKQLDIFLSTTVSLAPLKLFRNLEKLTVIGNCMIMSLDAVSFCHNMVHLCVNECLVNCLDGIENLVNLKQLHLCSNKLVDVRRISSLLNLETLWLNDNAIQSIDFIIYNTKLKSLWACNNVIQLLPDATNLNQLEEVMLAGNRICSFDDLRFLKTYTAVKSLSLKDCHFGTNIVCNVSNYKAFVATNQPKIEVLDSEYLTDEFRNQSLSIFAKKSLYYDMRSRLFKNLSSNFLGFGMIALSSFSHQTSQRRSAINKASRLIDLMPLNLMEYSDVTWPDVDLKKFDIVSETRALDQATMLRGREMYSNFNDTINRCILWAQTLFDIEFRSGGNIRLDECSSSSRESVRCSSILTFGRIEYDTMRVFRVTNRFMKDKFDVLPHWKAEDRKVHEADGSSSSNDPKKKKKTTRASSRSPRGRKTAIQIVPTTSRVNRRFLSCFFVVSQYETALRHAERGLDIGFILYRTVDKALSQVSFHNLYYLGICRIQVMGNELFEEDFIKLVDTAQVIIEYILHIFVNHRSQVSQSPMNSSRLNWQEPEASPDDLLAKDENDATREWSNSFSDVLPSERTSDTSTIPPNTISAIDSTHKLSLQEQLKLRSTGAIAALKELKKRGLLPQTLANSTDQSMIYDMLPFAAALATLKKQLGLQMISKESCQVLEDPNTWNYNSEMMKLINFTVTPFSQSNGKTHVSCFKEAMSFISFQFITNLSLHGRGVTEIVGELSSLTPVLEKIDVSHNKLRDLSFLSNITSLNWVDASHNNISEISSFPLLTSLFYLSLKGNYGETVEEIGHVKDGPNEMEVLSLKCPKLTSLDLRDTRFELASIDYNSSCRWLTVKRYFPNLTMLNEENYRDFVPSNAIQVEDDVAFERKGLDSMLDFFCKNIGCHLSWYNRNLTIQDIRKELQDRLESSELCVKGLWIDGNGLTRMSDVFNVFLAMNRAVKFPFIKTVDKQESTKSSVGEDTRAEEKTNLSCFLLHVSAEDNFLDNNSLHILSKFVNLISLNISGNLITSLVPLTSLKNIRRLCVERNSITSLVGIENMSHLRALYAANNKVEKLSDISRLAQDHEHLLVFDLSFNPCSMKPDYKDFIVFKLPSLKVLDSSTISKRDSMEAQRKFSGRLTWEILCPYSEENTPILKAFMSSSLRNVELFGIHASHFSKLRDLDLSDNQLTTFSCLSTLPSLERLTINKNLIQGAFDTEEEGDMILSREKKTGIYFPNLTYLSLISNKIVEPGRLYISLMKSLLELNLSQNAISDWEVDVMSSSLRKLNLSENRIRQVSVSSFGGLVKLDDLNLQKNGLRSPCQLGRLVLTRLDLSMNRFQHVDSVLQLTSQCDLLKSISVYSNPFSRKPGYIHLFLVHLPTLEIVDGELITIEERLRACQVVSNEKNALQEQWLLLQQRLYEYQYLQQLNQIQGPAKEQAQQQLVSQWQVQVRQQQIRQTDSQDSKIDQMSQPIRGQQAISSHSPVPIPQRPDSKQNKDDGSVRSTRGSKQTPSRATAMNQGNTDPATNPFVALLNQTAASKTTPIPWPPNKKTGQIVIPNSTGIVGTQLSRKDPQQSKRSASVKPIKSMAAPLNIVQKSADPSSSSYKTIAQQKNQDCTHLGHQFQLLSNEAREKAETNATKLPIHIPTPRRVDQAVKLSTQDEDMDDSKDNPRTRRLWELFAPLWTNADNPTATRKLSGHEMPMIMHQVAASPRPSKNDADTATEISRQVFRHPTLLSHRTPESIVQQTFPNATDNTVANIMLVNSNKVAVNDRQQFSKESSKVNTPRGSAGFGTNLPPVSRKSANLQGSYAYNQAKI